jgi:hypothetical protein
MVLGPQHLVGLGSFLPTRPLGMNLPSAGWWSSRHTDDGGRRESQSLSDLVAMAIRLSRTGRKRADLIRRMSLVRTGTHPIFAENGPSSASNLAGPWSAGTLPWRPEAPTWRRSAQPPDRHCRGRHAWRRRCGNRSTAWGLGPRPQAGLWSGFQTTCRTSGA